MRLIDADAMEKQAYDDVHYNAELEDWEFDVITHYLDHAPTIDAVPVVRCVNCIHYGAEASAFDAWTPFCLRHKLTTFPDDFCSYGEKRGDDAI